MEILAQLRRELEKLGLIRAPRVWVHPSCGAETAALQQAIVLLKGEVAPSESASVTLPNTEKQTDKFIGCKTELASSLCRQQR